MPIISDEMLQERGRYIAAHDAALVVLKHEQEYLLGISCGLGGTLASRNAARGAASNIGEQILDLDDLHVAIMGRFNSGINPPSAQVIENSERLTATLATDIQNATAAVTIVEIVSDFLSGWSGV